MFRRGSLCGLLAVGVLLAAPVHAGDDWQAMSFISGTLGNNAGRLCTGAPGTNRPSDLGCPTYAPYVTSAGNVGIGTTAPAATLQVSGSFIVSTSAQTTTPSLYVGTNGYVGVGTAAPLTTLDVVGRIKSSAYFESVNGLTTNFNFTGGNWTYRNSGFGHLLNMRSDSDEITLFTATSGLAGENATLIPNMTWKAGNVGIGTTSPNTKLEVNGLVSSTGLSVTGIVTATYFEGDGSRLTGLSVAAATDRIVSGTHALVANESSGYVSLSTGGTDWGYLGNTASYLPRLNAAGISITTANGISSTNGYFSGNVGIGTTTPTGRLEVVQETAGLNGITASQYNDGTNASRFELRKARGSYSVPTAVFSGDYLGILLSSGYDGSSYRTNGTGQIGFRAEQNFTPTAQGTYVYFSTVTSGTTALTERMRINSAGNVGIGTTSPNAKLDVYGTVSATQFVGDGSLLTGLSTAAATDRIVSGTSSVIANSNRGVSISAPLEVSGTIRIVTADVETCADGAAVGTIRINPATGAVEMCRK